MPLSIRQAIEKQVHAYLTHMERNGFWLGKNERRYDATAWDINNGLCEYFAYAVCDEVPGAEMFWLEELDSQYEDAHHCVIRYEGRFYDAECPQGVDRLEDLPYLRPGGNPRPSTEPLRKPI